MNYENAIGVEVYTVHESNSVWQPGLTRSIASVAAGALHSCKSHVAARLAEELVILNVVSCQQGPKQGHPAHSSSQKHQATRRGNLAGQINQCTPISESKMASVEKSIGDTLANVRGNAPSSEPRFLPLIPENA